MTLETIYPLIVVLIGVIVVIGMIVALRVNAFIALITAAIVVSLLSCFDPATCQVQLSSLGGSITKVAVAFGSAAGKIGIVIAMAAVIGKCMMDSGAADRVVRWFLNILGEKRAPTALMGSGFVLAIPVFFDTVFYLLVPLARSLCRRTKKNYLLYILAISAGGAITHTLVPPTPGPLFMAAELNIDLGLMMVMGAAIAFPTALIGLLVCGVMNRLMDVPMRPYAGEPEPEPLDDSQLPSFFMSILPVILPVLLISANTITKTIADAQHTPRLRSEHIPDWQTFAQGLTTPTGDHAWIVNKFVEELRQDPGEQEPDEQDTVEQDTVEMLRTMAAGGKVSDEEKAAVITAINELLRKKELFETGDFAPNKLNSPPAAALLGKTLERLSQTELERFHRLVLECALPEQLEPHVWDTPSRKASYLTSVVGSPNLALLLSAAVAMFVLVRSRGLTYTELGKATETALMSGGVIILITAGGGAFGAMLREAGVEGLIKSAIDPSGETFILIILLAGFGVAAALKIAQGSSTVAMITAASLFAAMDVTFQTKGLEVLGYVYLAVAIGCGSLFGSWMNDSGFWIFARMGNLTEVEALKSWTVMLAIIAVVGLGVTMLFAFATMLFASSMQLFMG
jgi:H+/gluconate symporter-like permease